MAKGSQKYPYRELGARLAATREAMGYSQAEFGRTIGLEKNIYNPFETGKRRLTLDDAIAIRKRHGVPLDWIYCADASKLPGELYAKLIKFAA